MNTWFQIWLVYHQSIEQIYVELERIRNRQTDWVGAQSKESDLRTVLFESDKIHGSQLELQHTSLM